MHALLRGHTRDDDLVADGTFDVAHGAHGALGARTVGDFLHDAARIATALPDPSPGSQVLFVVRHDHYALACALAACAVRGHALALPPEIGRESITALADDPRTAVIAHDTPSSIGVRVDQVLAEAAPVTALTRSALAEAALVARLFFRGGDARLEEVERVPDAWLLEAAALAHHAGLCPGQRVATTLAPGQPFAIVLGILGPLLTGGVLLRDVLGADSHRERLRALSPDVVVSVPAHLRALSGAELEARTYVSGLAPLASEVAAPIRARAALVDVLYDDARGALALRAHEGPFSPLPELCATVAGGRLALSGPWLQGRDVLEVVGDAAAFVPLGAAQDTLPLPDGRTVDAPSLADALLHIAGVHDAALAVAPEAEGRPRRLVAAVVAERTTLPAVEAVLRSAMAGGPAVELLRVAHVKRDSSARIPRADVLRLFRLRADGTALHFALPPFTRVETSAAPHDALASSRFEVEIPADYAYYDGHFAGYPILAGAVQLSELVLPCVRALQPSLGALREVQRLKFTGRIQPGQRVSVELAPRADGLSVDFSIKRDKSACAAGTLLFEVHRR
jgi:hypothetical protein